MRLKLLFQLSNPSWNILQHMEDRNFRSSYLDGTKFATIEIKNLEKQRDREETSYNTWLPLHGKSG